MGHQNGGNNHGRQRQRSHLTERATNNVNLMDAGQQNQLNSQLQQAQQDYLRSSNAAGSIYPGAQQAIGDLQRPQFDRIGNEFDQALGTVQGLFGGDQAQPYMAAGESAAGMGLGNAYGEAGHTMLANADAREGMYRSSAQRDAGLKQQQSQDTLLQQMQDTVQGYNNQLGQLRADDPWQIQNEYDRLWEQKQQQKALASKNASDKAFSDWLMGQASGAVGGGSPGGHPGNGPHDGRVDTPNHNLGGDSGASGQYPTTGGYGDTAAGGNNAGGGTPWVQRSHDINQATSFDALPAWIQDLYRNYTGHNRWASVQAQTGQHPHRGQVFRKTREHVADLWAGDQSNGYQYPGLGGAS